MTTDTVERADRTPDSTTDKLHSLVFRYQDTLLLIGRVLIGGFFVMGGYGKITGLDAFAAGLAKSGIPAPVAYLGAFAEFSGGLCLMLGLATRYAALLLVAFTIVATLIAHRYWEFTDAAMRRVQFINFEKNLMIIGGIIAFVVAGAGRISVDRLLRRR